eukprot:COSAG06_NODE_1955_length_7985_cov_18.401598_6_plen_59_part_00
MHTPNVEYQLSIQSTQFVESTFGPVPAPHAEHVVWSLFTTFGVMVLTRNRCNRILQRS